MDEHLPAYVRLLNVLGAIRSLCPFNTLTADEESLLHDLLIRWHEGGPLTLGEIMRDVSNASQTTAYRRVVALRDKGMVELRVDSKDRRIRFVEPTTNALDYAERLETALAETPSLARSGT